jgi:hypothetical protein
MRFLIYFLFVGSIIVVPVIAKADCVWSAKSKTRFTRLDTHTIVLQGGFSADILIKTYSFINNNANVSILKDSFCSYESAVLYVDGSVVDVQEVKKLD